MPDITLSIIIPYYTETEKEIFPLLASINGQVGVDFEEIECILVNDGNDNRYPPEFLGLFTKLPVRCVYMPENRGPGMARQCGLDGARGDYVMFCDADDILHNVGVLGAFFKVIEDEYPDMIGSPWYEEKYDKSKNSMYYILHEKDYTWLHGKAFLRSFLAEKKIRFHEELRIHEDTYFLTLVAMETDDICWPAIISYIWKYHPTSITRINDCAYNIDGILQHIKALSCAYAVIEERKPEKLGFLITETIVFYFFNLSGNIWREPPNTAQLLRAELALSELLARYRKYFEDTSQEQINSLYNRKRERQFASDMINEPFHEWLKRITQPLSLD